MDLDKIILDANPDYTGEVATTGFIDTGSYAFNALVSGSIYGGFPDNRVIALAGSQATGKCVRGTEKIRIYSDNGTIERIKNKLGR